MAQVAFRNALGRCGLSAPAQIKFTEEGCDVIADLPLASISDVEKLLKALRKERVDVNGVDTAVITMSSAQKIMGLYCFAYSHQQMGLPFQAGTFANGAAGQPQTMTIWTNRARFHKEEEERLRDQPPAKPAKFTTWGKWRPFVESLEAYMAQVRSKQISSVPMSYLMREHTTVTPQMEAAQYPDLDAQLVALIRFDHQSVEQEDKSMFHLLTELTRGTDAWPLVKVFQRAPSFRNAWIALRDQGSGPEAQQLQKDAARAAIAAAVYTGKGNFTMQRYTTIHLEENGNLDRLGEPKHESEKVTAFLDGIKCPQLDTYKKLARNDTNYRGNFMRCQVYMNNSVLQEKLDLKKVQGGTRNVGSTNNSNPKRRGGPGRGHGAKNKKKTRRYSHDEWSALSVQQRAEITAARKAESAAKKAARQAAAAQAEAPSPAPAAAAAVSPSAIIAALKEMSKEDGNNGKKITLSVSSLASTGEPKTGSQPTKDAGLQFGRRGAATKKPNGKPKPDDAGDGDKKPAAKEDKKE